MPTLLPYIPDDVDPLSTPVISGPTVVAAAASPASTTATLSGTGIWLITAQARLNGSYDHMMTSLFLTQYYVASSNNTLLTTLIGATSKATGSSFTLNSCTCSNPTSGGVLTFSAAWGDGLTHAITWTISARRLSPL